MTSDNPSRTIWQISAGPASRSYVDVFLQYGVALVGPGDAGPWTPARDDGEFEGGFVRRFASELAVGDVLVLRTGLATVAAIGLVAGAYEDENAFDDVNGWGLQHMRRGGCRRLSAGRTPARAGVGATTPRRSRA